MENIGGKPELYVCVCVRVLGAQRTLRSRPWRPGSSPPPPTSPVRRATRDTLSFTDDIIHMSLYEPPSMANKSSKGNMDLLYFRIQNFILRKSFHFQALKRKKRKGIFFFR